MGTLQDHRAGSWSWDLYPHLGTQSTLGCSTARGGMSWDSLWGPRWHLCPRNGTQQPPPRGLGCLEHPSCRGVFYLPSHPTLTNCFN